MFIAIADPPMRVVSVRTLENDTSKPFIERVIINDIKYANGSIWQRS